MRTSLTLASILASCVGFLAIACSGTSNVDIPALGDASSATDAPTNSGDSSSPPDGQSPVEEAAAPPPPDAGLTVHESPAPTCNDLPQSAPTVVPTHADGDAPTPTPIANITPGLYVVKEIVYYGNTAVDPSPQQTTGDFTGTREYYISTINGMSAVYTLDYTIANGQLGRTIVCTSTMNSGTVLERIGASTNGFTIYVDENGGATETVRYERSP